ncbi:MAG: hypothetical protein JRJ65_10755 [Deltaproteobacteria bacterium]|nr:hypothetical protein [Deltaproteobacteria bacterium]
MTYSKGGKEQTLILEYDGVEYHTKNPDIVTKHNFSQEYLDYDISRQIELESYGYRFLRLNKFNLRPEQKGETKTDVLDRLLRKTFVRLANIPEGLDVSDVLKNLNVLRNEGFCNAGVLIFCEKVTPFFST